MAGGAGAANPVKYGDTDSIFVEMAGASVAARRTCSSVPSRMTSDKAASTASRVRRWRSAADSGSVSAVEG